MQDLIPARIPCGSAAGARPRTAPTADPATTARPANRRPHCRGRHSRMSDKAKLNDRRVGRHRSTSIFGEQRQCPRKPRIVVENLDGLSPPCRLRGVDLAQVQNVALYDTPACHALVLDNAPIVVRLAVLLSLGLPQKHDPANLAEGIRCWEQGRSSLQPFSVIIAKDLAPISNAYPTPNRQKWPFRESNPRRRVSPVVRAGQRVAAIVRELPSVRRHVALFPLIARCRRNRRQTAMRRSSTGGFCFVLDPPPVICGLPASSTANPASGRRTSPARPRRHSPPAHWVGSS